jgi:site-specific recombinase XerD
MPARELAARTCQEYKHDLMDLIEFLAERGITRLEQVSLQDLENYQAEMGRRGYEASTRERNVALQPLPRVRRITPTPRTAMTTRK